VNVGVIGNAQPISTFVRVFAEVGLTPATAREWSCHALVVCKYQEMSAKEGDTTNTIEPTEFQISTLFEYEPPPPLFSPPIKKIESLNVTVEENYEKVRNPTRKKHKRNILQSRLPLATGSVRDDQLLKIVSNTSI
jgi:hypothetical protein